MFRGDLIIDGYNLLHAAGLAPPSGNPQGLERARRALLHLVSGRLSPHERERTTVVFDAPGRDAPGRLMGPSPPQEVDGLLVVFAEGDGDADEEIEWLIRQNSAPRRLCVVSSDHRLQKAARRRRAAFLDSDQFLGQLARRLSQAENRPEEVEPAAKRSGRLPPGEVEAWLRVFQDLEDIRFPGDAREPHGHTPRTAASRRPAGSTRRRPGSLHQPHGKRENPTDAKVSNDKPRDAATDPSLDEVAFWESRIRELDEEDSV